MSYHPFLYSSYEGVTFECNTDLSRVLERPFFGLVKLIVLGRQGQKVSFTRLTQNLSQCSEILASPSS